MLKKYNFSFLFLVILIVFVSKAQENSKNFVWRNLKNEAFSAGEKLCFSIRWGPITAGYAEMRIDDIQEINGRKAYHIVTEAKSLPFFDAFYKVRNRDESWIDVESLCSLKYVKDQYEGGYIKKETTIFDHINRRFELTEKVGEKEPKIKTGEIPSYVQDILSALYYIRTQDLKRGKEYYITTQTGDKNYPLRVVVYDKEKVEVPAGKFKCFVVEPFVTEDAGIFKAKGKIWIWFTDDKYKIPVLMKSKIFIGYITAELIESKL